MNFSAILDISSFFIGMIINLLLIALICYYFKRKYENLEIIVFEEKKKLSRSMGGKRDFDIKINFTS